jgi:nucleotide-binding universal stress UspA family protein
MYTRAVVPLDGSELSAAILPFVTRIAGPLDMEVVLLRVVEPISPRVIESSRHIEVEDVEARLAEARTYLRPVMQELAGEGVRALMQVRHGDPVTEIVDCAKTVQADLIAMNTHGRSGLGRLLFGSVAEAVLRKAEIPVLLMRLTESQVRSRRAREAVR